MEAIALEQVLQEFQGHLLPEPRASQLPLPRCLQIQLICIFKSLMKKVKNITTIKSGILLRSIKNKLR